MLLEAQNLEITLHLPMALETHTTSVSFKTFFKDAKFNFRIFLQENMAKF